MIEKNTKQIYQYLIFSIDLCNKIDYKVKDEKLSGIYFASDGHLVKEFLEFKEAGQNMGFDDAKKRMVIKSMLLL